MENSVIEFERITKFQLRNFISSCGDFFEKDYPEIAKYFSGQSKDIDQKHFDTLKKLIISGGDCSTQFKLFRNKFQTVEYWELIDLIEDIRTKLLTSSQLSKWLRSSRTNSNFSSGFSFNYTMNYQQTMEDISSSVLETPNPQNDWALDIAVKNDLKESQWDIDGGTNLTLFKEFFQSQLVTSVIDNLIGEAIYGKDVDKKITFENNDLKVLDYRETLNQTVLIYCQLKKGDIPEFENIGIPSTVIGGNLRSLTIPTVSREMKKTFLSNDIFAEFNISAIKYVEGNLFIEFEVRTKYDSVIKHTTIV